MPLKWGRCWVGVRTQQGGCDCRSGLRTWEDGSSWPASRCGDCSSWLCVNQHHLCLIWHDQMHALVMVMGDPSSRSAVSKADGTRSGTVGLFRSSVPVPGTWHVLQGERQQVCSRQVTKGVQETQSHSY